jgi:transcriptional regulator with XRE-family HTH domain
MSNRDSGTSTATDTEIGNRIRAELAYRDISQKDFAPLVGISYKRMLEITKGKRVLNVLELRRIALALDLSPVELLEDAA